MTVNFTNLTAVVPTNVVWNFGDGNTSSSLSPTHTYTTPGVYTVCFTTFVGADCSSTACAQISVNTPVCTSPRPEDTQETIIEGETPKYELGVDRIQEAGDEEVSPVQPMQILSEPSTGFKVQPNPTTDIAFLTGTFAEGTRVMVYDLSGKPVQDRMLDAEFSQVAIDLTGFSSGVYMVVVQGADGQVTNAKILKQ